MHHFSFPLLLVGLICTACRDEPVAPEPEPMTTTDSALSAAASTITAADMHRRVGVLAADSMQGRDTPSPGLEASANYIAGELSAMGLEPAGTDGYLQRWDYAYDVRDSTDVVLELAAAGGPLLEQGRDFVALGSTPGDTTGSILWGGSAETSPDAGGLDMKGKVMLYDLPVSRFDIPTVLAGIDADAATSQGGAAAYGLIVATDFTEEEMAKAESITRRWSRTRPMFWIREAAARTLLSDAGADLTALRDEGPQNVDASIHVRARLASVTATPPNVVARLPGSDPSLRDQYVVVSAHFDHLGVGLPDATGDSIDNGADDNASGTAAVLEVAQALASLEKAPPRSVLFLLASGEEYGLLGSAAFLRAPTVPVFAMVADVNMDMIGRNAPDSILAVGGGYSSLGATAIQMAKAKEEISLTVVVNAATDRAFPGSDNLSFACRHVPALFLHSGLHDDYHRPSDEVARLDADKAARVARLALYVVDWTATAHGVPTWTAEGRQALDASRLACP